MESLQSPVRGLEKLAEDLRYERKKSTNALQDRSRQKIEIENLKGQLADAHMDIDSKQTQLENLARAHELSEQRIKDNDERLEDNENLFAKLKKELDATVLEHQEQAMAQQILQEQYDQSKKVEVTLTQNISKLEGAVASRGDVIEELEREIKRQQVGMSQQEQRIREMSQDLAERFSRDDETTTQLQRAEVVEENYKEMQASSQHLKAELDESQQRGGEMSYKLREAQNRIRALEASEINLHDELNSTRVRLEKLKQEVTNSDQVTEELMKRMEAESENASLARDRAEEATRQREQVERQQDKVQEGYEKSLKRCEELEEEVASMQSTVLTLGSDLAKAQKDCVELETALEEAQGGLVLAQEVETLRTQLTDVRKKLARRDIEEDVSRLTPAVMLEREKSSKIVYDRIIDDLRDQLAKMSSNYQVSQERLKEAGLRLLRVEELEADVQIYKENSVKYSQESMSAVESAQEERVKSEKTAHEMRILINDIKSSENELHSVKSTLLKVRDDYDSEKVRSRQLHLEKVSAEREAAEMMVAKNRLKIETDNYKFRADTAELEVQRLTRSLTDSEMQVEELKKKRAEADRQRTVMLERLNKTADPGKDRSREAYLQLERDFKNMQHDNKNLGLELDTLQKSYKCLKGTNAGQTEELANLRSEIADLMQDREFFRRDVSQLERGGAERQIHGLRQDLAVTSEQWQSGEEARQSKEEDISQLTARLESEKDQADLLRAQIKLLEKRGIESAKELAIFRSLDIYQKSMAAALVQRRNNAHSLDHDSFSNADLDIEERLDSRVSTSTKKAVHKGRNGVRDRDSDRDFGREIDRGSDGEDVSDRKIGQSYMSYSDDESDDGQGHHLSFRGQTFSKIEDSGGSGQRSDTHYRRRQENSSNNNAYRNTNMAPKNDDVRASTRFRDNGVLSAFDDDEDHSQLGPSLDIADISLDASLSSLPLLSSTSDDALVRDKKDREELKERRGGESSRVQSPYSEESRDDYVHRVRERDKVIDEQKVRNGNRERGRYREKVERNYGDAVDHSSGRLPADDCSRTQKETRILRQQQQQSPRESLMSGRMSTHNSTSRAAPSSTRSGRDPAGGRSDSNGNSGRSTISYHRPTKADFDRAKRLLSRN